MAIAPSNAPQVDTPSAQSYSDSSPQRSYPSGQNAPESYHEKPGSESYQPEDQEAAAPGVTASERPAQYTAEDRASRTGYRLRRIVLQ